ncbi:hypothetical protein HRbin34_00366 [bacterium HR34]|nr:hypothetical protein HRbin34_00366 [bacterium HR34]
MKKLFTFKIYIILIFAILFGAVFYFIGFENSNNYNNINIITENNAQKSEVQDDNISQTADKEEDNTLINNENSKKDGKENNQNKEEDKTYIALKDWLDLWGVSLSDFIFTNETDIVYPFNEVMLDGREKRIPNFDKATAWSPDKTKWVNYLYNYEQEGLSSVIIYNPRGEKRIFRVAFCNNYCNYHFAKWIDNNSFVVGAYKKDVKSCSQDIDLIKECPSRLFYLVYDLFSNKIKEFEANSIVKLSSEEIDKKICKIYAPCAQ